MTTKVKEWVCLKCPSCKGNGYEEHCLGNDHIMTSCVRCDGSGLIAVKQVIEDEIPWTEYLERKNFNPDLL